MRIHIAYMLLLCSVLSCRKPSSHKFVLTISNNESHLISKVPDPYRLDVYLEKSSSSTAYFKLTDSNNLAHEIALITNDTTVLLDWYDPFCKIILIDTEDVEQNINGSITFY